MKFLLILFNLFLVILLAGCSQEPDYTRLNKGNFQELDVKLVTSVDLVSVGASGINEPENWFPSNQYMFPVTEPERIQLIHNCIKTGEETEYAAPFRNLLFKTEDIVYVLSIGWNRKSCYGNFWKSPALLEAFESWGLQHAKGVSNGTPCKELPKDLFKEAPLKW